MYNIDFRANGQIISIPICFNDTLYKLITRMKEFQPFRKYDNIQLQDKLIRCLKQILNRSQLEPNVRQRIIELISNKSYQNEDTYEVTTSKSNNTIFLNSSQQQSSNNKKNNFINNTNNNTCQQASTSTKRLNRNYNLKPFQLQQSYQHQIQNQLNYKYKNQKLTFNKKESVHQKYSDQVKEYDYDRVKNQRKVNVSEYLENRKYSYNFQKGLSSSPEGKRTINQEDILRGSINNNHVRHNESLLINPTRHNESLSFYKQTKQRNQPNKSFSQQRIPSRNTTQRRANIDHLVSLTYKRPCQQPTNSSYYPVPKLNQLIDRSRSMSQIVRKDSLLQNRLESRLENRLESRDLNRSTNQPKPNAGKIQHRPNYNADLNQKYNDINYKQNYLPSRTKPYTINEVPSNISYEHKRVTNATSYLNQSPLQVKNNNYPLNFKQQGYKPNKKVYSYL